MAGLRLPEGSLFLELYRQYCALEDQGLPAPRLVYMPDHEFDTLEAELVENGQHERPFPDDHEITFWGIRHRRAPRIQVIRP